VQGGYHWKLDKKIHLITLFHISIWGNGAFGELSPPNPLPPLWRDCILSSRCEVQTMVGLCVTLAASTCVRVPRLWWNPLRHKAAVACVTSLHTAPIGSRLVTEGTQYSTGNKEWTWSSGETVIVFDAETSRVPGSCPHKATVTHVGFDKRAVRNLPPCYLGETCSDIRQV